jgi:putative Ca2+/H+ antiporter (TMEM165/GDT1 family)
MRFDFIVFLSTFAFILPAELPDKSFIVTLVLSTKQKRSAVWVGATIAFGLQATIAVSAGKLLTKLPKDLVVGVVLTIFTIGAIYLYRSAWKERGSHLETSDIQESAKKTWIGAMLMTLGIVFTAEWGDITQLGAAANAAATGNALSVGLGAWLAESTVAGLGVWLGSRIKDKLRPAILHLITAIVLTLLAFVALSELIGS